MELGGQCVRELMMVNEIKASNNYLCGGAIKTCQPKSYVLGFSYLSRCAPTTAAVEGCDCMFAYKPGLLIANADTPRWVVLRT